MNGPVNILLRSGPALCLAAAIGCAQKISCKRDTCEPIRTEEALVHRKSDFITRFRSTYFLHFYIAQRDLVLDCSVSRSIWMNVNRGDRGMLRHQGNTFLSFTRTHDGEIFTHEPPNERDPEP